MKLFTYCRTNITSKNKNNEQWLEKHVDRRGRDLISSADA